MGRKLLDVIGVYRRVLKAIEEQVSIRVMNKKGLARQKNIDVVSKKSWKKP